MSGWATAADLQVAPQLVRAWNKSSIDSEGTTFFGGVWTNSAPATTPGVAYTNDETGLFAFPNTTPQKWLAKVIAEDPGNTGPGVFWVMDRLVGVGGLDLSITTAQTVNSTALPRYTSGAGVMVFAMASVAVGATNSPVMRLSSYTNQDGTSSRAGPDFSWTPNITTDIGSVMGPFPLQDNDIGVRSVETITLSTASTNAASRFEIYLMYPLAMIGLENGGTVVSEHDTLGGHLHQLRRVYDGASLVALLGGYAGGEGTRGSIAVALDV